MRPARQILPHFLHLLLKFSYLREDLNQLLSRFIELVSTTSQDVDSVERLFPIAPLHSSQSASKTHLVHQNGEGIHDLVV